MSGRYLLELNAPESQLGTMQGNNSSLGRELLEPPGDGVSNLRFSTSSEDLLVSSWDGTMRLYDAAANILRGTHSYRAPVLDCCFLEEGKAFSACADGTVQRYDFSVGRGDIVGKHDVAARCVEYSFSTGQLLSGGWDRMLYSWDVRTPNSGRSFARVALPERVYSMSCVGYRLVVACAGRHVGVFDLRNLSQPEHVRESSLKYQTRCVRCYPNGTGYALSSVEGRVAMEFFDPSEEVQAKKYAFKCHRKMENGRDTVYPVNALAFHPIFGTFASGGCDAFVNIWDGDNKKRLYQYAKYPTSIAALAFSRDGQYLAVASSYTFEFGEIQHPKDQIFVKSVNDVEVKPKPKAFTAA